MSTKPLVSIVIPVYNTTKWVTNCVMSVLHQNYDNIEVIIIDDGSSDGSEKKCDDFEKMDYRVKVIHKKNEGVSVARNLGISLAKGKYLIFIDSDDVISSNMIQSLVDLAIRENSDITMCGFEILQEQKDNHLAYECKNKYREGVLSKTNALKNVISNSGFKGFVWNKLIVRSLFDGNNESIRFNANIFVCEDLLLICQLIDNSRKIAFTENKLYGYINHPGSAINSITEKTFTSLDAKREILPIFDKYAMMDAKSWYVYAVAFFLTYPFEKEVKKRSVQLRQELNTKKSWFVPKIHTKKERIIFRTIYLFPRFTGNIYGILRLLHKKYNVFR